MALTAITIMTTAIAIATIMTMVTYTAPTAIMNPLPRFAMP
jgi:hypothetical protein